MRKCSRLLCIVMAAASCFAAVQPDRGKQPAAGRAQVLQRAAKLASSNPVEAAGAAYWLGEQYEAAEPAIPQLIAALADDRPVDSSRIRRERHSIARRQMTSPGEEAAVALTKIGDPAVEALIAVVRNSGNAVARRNAVAALGAIQARRTSSSERKITRRVA